jgi:hypothetical protein
MKRPKSDNYSLLGLGGTGEGGGDACIYQGRLAKGGASLWDEMWSAISRKRVYRFCIPLEKK